MTIENTNTDNFVEQIEKLNAKNSELLGQIRKLKDDNIALNSNYEKLSSELTKVKTGAITESMIVGSGVNADLHQFYLDAVQRELGIKLSVDEEFNPVFKNAEGELFKIDGEILDPSNQDKVKAHITDVMLAKYPSFFNKPTGSGATGGNDNPSPKIDKPKENMSNGNASFGIR